VENIVIRRVRVSGMRFSLALNEKVSGSIPLCSTTYTNWLPEIRSQFDTTSVSPFRSQRPPVAVLLWSLPEF
jgi:hypothetical protein